MKCSCYCACILLDKFPIYFHNVLSTVLIWPNQCIHLIFVIFHECWTKPFIWHSFSFVYLSHPVSFLRHFRTLNSSLWCWFAFLLSHWIFLNYQHGGWVVVLGLPVYNRSDSLSCLLERNIFLKRDICLWQWRYCNYMRFFLSSR